MQSLLLYEPDPEIERTFRLRRKKQRIKEQRYEVTRNSNMAGEERRTLRDFVTLEVQGIASSIARPVMHANNFDLKPALISMVQQSQFDGTPLEDLNLHLLVVLEVHDTLKLNGVSSVHLLPFSFRDKARAWLHSMPSGCTTTWDELTRAFLAKFFPPSKTASLRNQIINFL